MRLRSVTMGMPLTIQALGPNATTAALDACLTLFRQADYTFSPYKPDSVISRLARGEVAKDAIPPEVRMVLDICNTLTRDTDGYFNANGPRGLDPSGYVKGWAIYRAACLLDSKGITNYCIDLAGDIQVAGSGPGGGPWRIAIKNPSNPRQAIKMLQLADGAVATSGTYERGSHIYDPHTGAAATEVLSLTVVGDRIDIIDAYATAACAMGMPGLIWLKLHGYDAMMVTSGGVATSTAGFADYEQLAR